MYLLHRLHVGACMGDNKKHVGKCEVGMVYLNTYSRADLNEIITREAFADAMKDA